MQLIPKLDGSRSQRLKPEHRAVCDTLLAEEIAQRKWYHRMDLGNGIATPGFPWEALWENTRRVRSQLDFTGKTVLDLGSWDGMWAFEAEALGAALVVASDCMNYWQIPWYRGMDNLLLLREALYSRVIPLWNIAPSSLRERLDNILYSHPLLKDGFDIVQHLGLLYHLRDPLRSLAQARSVMKAGGTLLLETAADRSVETDTMRFNFGPGAFYDDFTTWWAPTLTCLREMLRTSLFEMDETSVAWSEPAGAIGRVSLRASAVAPTNAVGQHYNVDPAYGHGFGEHLIGRLPTSDMRELNRYFEERFPKSTPAEEGI